MSTDKTMQDTASARRPQFWVPTLYLAQGLPFYAITVVAAQMFKSMGVANGDIARWTAAIGMAWVLKPLWSPFLELAPSKKAVVVTFQLVGGACMGLVALALQLPSWFAACLAMLWLVAISAATHDIACDGLYIASLTKKQQAQYAGWTGTFFNAGRFISMGGLVILAGYLEKTQGITAAWTIVFCILAVAMTALGLYHGWSLPAARNPTGAGHTAADIARTLREVIIDFFNKPGIWVSILFIILFRAGEAQVQTIGPLFLRDTLAKGGLGLTTDQVGIVYGTSGTIAFIVGSIAGGYFSSWLGLRRAILPLILAVNLPNLVFWYLSTWQPQDLAIIGAALSAEMFGYGFGFVGIILYMMQVVAPGKYTTAHYAFATGIMQLGQVLFRWISGDVQTAIGYQHFFVWVLVAAIPVAILSQFIPMASRVVEDAAQPDGEPQATAAQ